jgi:hypothetical protein
MKTYVAHVDFRDESCVVMVEPPGEQPYPLPLRLDVANKSPTGFAWGYGGSGPAQLALAILCDCLGNEHRALKYMQDFKRKMIMHLDQDKGWSMTEIAVRSAVNEIRHERHQRHRSVEFHV